jgi:hypothetical protein
MKVRRTALTEAGKPLLQKLQRGAWTQAELECVLAHLPADTALKP